MAERIYQKKACAKVQGAVYRDSGSVWERHWQGMQPVRRIWISAGLDFPMSGLRLPDTGKKEHGKKRKSAGGRYNGKDQKNGCLDE